MSELLPSPPPPPEPPTPPAARPLLPWEDRSAPRLKAFGETFVLFVTRPAEAFERMPTGAPVGRAVAWYLIFGWAATIVGQIYGLFFSFSVASLPFIPPEARRSLAATAGMRGVLAVATIVAAPLILAVTLLIVSGIYHLMLMILGGAAEGFTATLRVVCYAATAAVAQGVPVCGGLAYLVWGLVLQVLGLSVAQKASLPKALAAVLLPILLCGACVVTAAIMLAASLGSLGLDKIR